MTLAALLGELKGIDPDTADDIGDIVNVIGIMSDGSFSSDAYYPDFIIQGCIQRACERRGWLWTHSKEDSKSEAAIAGTPYEAIIFDDEVNIIVEDIYGASAAEALLAAYIAAVREEDKC